MTNTVTMTAPSGIGPGSIVIYPDGTDAAVDANSQIACPGNFVSFLLNAGYTLPNEGPAASSNTSSATSKGTSAGLGASSAASKGDSSGTQASQANSASASNALVVSTLTSRVTSKGG